MKKKKITAVIPIKLNNERVPHKNTKILGEHPLLYYIQAALLRCKKCDEVYVYCSSTQVLPYLLDGVKFFQRPEYLDTSAANFTQIFEQIMTDLPSDFYVYAHATAPFLTTETIDRCIEKVTEGSYDSAFTATKIQDFLWQNHEPLNFDPCNLPRSQDLTPIYRETSGVWVLEREVFARYRRRIGQKPYIAEVSFPESIDINTPEDFALAELMAKINQ